MSGRLGLSILSAMAALLFTSGLQAQEATPTPEVLSPELAKRLADVNARVKGLMKELPRRPVMSGKGMPTKLGLYYIMGDAESQGTLDLADAGLIPLIKTGSQSGDRGWRAIQHNPKTIWIVGTIDIRVNSSEFTPKQQADAIYDQAVKELNYVPKDWRSRIDFLEVAQVMWQPGSAEEAIWFSEMMCELLPRVAKLGQRPIVMNSSVGNLPDKAAVLDGAAPGLRLAHHLGGAWGYQGYSLKYTKDLEIERWHSLRYRQAHEHYRRNHPDIADLTMILLEGGIDDVGDADKSGWLARGSLDQYTDWLDWYNSELMKDDYCIGVTLFKIGAPSIWKSFELEPVVPWLTEHYRKAYGK